MESEGWGVATGGQGSRQRGKGHGSGSGCGCGCGCGCGHARMAEALMAQLALGDAVGCGLLLLLLAVVLLMAFWPFLLAAGLLVLAIHLLRQLLALQSFAMLQRLTTSAQRWVAGEVCLLDGRHGRIRGVSLQGPAVRARISLEIESLGAEGVDGAQRQLEQRLLTPPAVLSGLGSNAGFRRFLASQGIRCLNDLSVEAKALVAALECLGELEWTGQALLRLDAMLQAVEDCLARAEGNALLQPSLPSLLRARQTFAREHISLREHRQEAETMLRKLRDFLEVPQTLRPLLSDDLDNLIDHQRRRDLQQSFQELLLLNDSFRELGAASPAAWPQASPPATPAPGAPPGAAAGAAPTP